MADITLRCNLLPLCVLSLFLADCATAADGASHRKWAASWTTAISGPLGGSRVTAGVPSAADVQGHRPEFDFALPGGEAEEQSFRMIVRPDLWSDTVRLRLSNVFGSQEVDLGAATIALQEAGGKLMRGTNARLTFGGRNSIAIARGAQVLSDPVRLPFVSRANRRWIHGRNLAVSFFVRGRSGFLSVHGVSTGTSVTSYISRPNSGDHTEDESDLAYPYATNSFLLVNELDVLADPGTAVVCALGDSITDGGGATLNGYDGWPELLSARLHAIYGDKVSVVNMGIRGNTVVTRLAEATSQPVVERLDRDVLGIEGLTSVVWLEGINDLGLGQAEPEQIIEGYRQVVDRLHAKGIVVVGGTILSSVWPLPNYDRFPTANLDRLRGFGSAKTNTSRGTVNRFIRTSGVFDGVADMAAVTEDPATGALYEALQIGDYVHPNRAGHQVIAGAVDLTVLGPQKSRLK